MFYCGELWKRVYDLWRFGMKFGLIFLMLSSALNAVSFADPLKLEDIDAKDVVQQLEKSQTVFAASLESVRSYAKSLGLVEASQPTVRPLIHQNNEMPGLFILDLIYRPESLPAHGSYLAIRVAVYFRSPSHFERTTGRNQFNFYKIETMVDTVHVGPPPPQPPPPGDISSAGRR
jgi:hypothetical protein